MTQRIGYRRRPPVMADQVLVLALCGSHEGWAASAYGVPKIPADVDVLVAAAELAELVLLGQTQHVGSTIVAPSHREVGEPGLDAALSRLTRSPEIRTDTWWVRELAKDRPDQRRLQQLRERGLVIEYLQPTRTLFGTKQVKRWHAPEGGSEEWLLDRLRAALRSGQADERTTMLLALVHASGLHRRWFRGYGTAELDRRTALVLKGSWVDRALTQARGQRVSVAF